MVVFETVISAGRGVLVNVQVMLSRPVGVTVKLVPTPEGSTVVDVAFEFVHEMKFVY